MAITEQEKQEIIDELLAEIRANGLDYAGQTITFPNAFNVTQTERQNVKIPAIDERSATPVHGNVDLEALLTAYGVTHVEEIASDISSNYMKKVADSNLNMNGYATQNISSDTVYARFGSTRDIIHMPRIIASDLGLDGTDKQAFFKAYFKKMVELFPNKAYIHFSGTIIIDNIYYIDGYVNSTYANNLDADGVPLRLSFSLQSYMFPYPTFWYRGTAGDFVPMTIPTFPYGDTTKDNRINAMGSNYIRYENGLQICWGYVDYDPINIDTATGDIYRLDLTTTISFGQPFNSRPAVTVHNNANAWVGKVDYSTTSINTVSLYGSVVSEYSVGLSYFAIGKWK